jgi:hypothetical protein
MFSQPFRAVVRAAAVTAVFAAAMLAADSPFAGTWKLNPSKSQPGESGIGGNALVRIESTATGLRISVQGADEQGQPISMSYTASFDGTASPVTGSPVSDSVSIRRVDDRTITVSGAKNGAIVFKDRRVVSADGNTMTITREGTNPEGHAYNAVLVFDRQ